MYEDLGDGAVDAAHPDRTRVAAVVHLIAQLHTRAAPRFTELRTHVYEQIQIAKRGGPAAGSTQEGGAPADVAPPAKEL